MSSVLLQLLLSLIHRVEWQLYTNLQSHYLPIFYLTLIKIIKHQNMSHYIKFSFLGL